MAPSNHKFSRPFFLRIKHLQCDEDPRQPNPATGPDPNWLPSRSSLFRIKSSTGWWIWDPGHNSPDESLRHLRQPNPQELHHRRDYKTSTIIWDPGRHNYIQVPIDCSVKKLSTTAYSWRRLSFGRYEDLALIGHQREKTELHLPGPERWFEQLLPVTCKAQNNEPRHCKLAGHLSILIGLIAFSAAEDYACWAIDLSFRHDTASTEFTPNLLPKSPKHEKRAMVVEIAYDSRKVTADQLRAWEEGQNGEIFS